MQQIIVFPKEFVGFMHVWEMSAFMQSWGQLVANLSLPGAILVLLWTVLGPTSSVLGPTWANQAPHGADLGRLEPQVRPSYGYLGTSGAIMAPLWALMKPSSRQLGPTKRHMEPINRDMELTWHQLGVNLGRLGAALVHLVPNLALISVQLGR